MKNPRRVKVYVIDQSDAGRAIKCSMTEDMEDPFFLPKSQIEPTGKVTRKAFHEFDIAEFIYLSHWQLCGRDAFEEEKKRRKAREAR
jgi:hypothetical protein